MIIVFDMDDTLYPERSYVESGFRAVAEFGLRQYGWDAAESLRDMLATLDREGRGAVFDRWLASHGALSRAAVRKCVAVYRHHRPRLELYPEARDVLARLSSHPLYVVTDGHKVVQALKARSLGLDAMVRKVYVTHRYGVANAKPSLRCFDLIRARERAEWRDLVHVGDNPRKDFVALNRVGAHTVRVTTGAHAAVAAEPGFDAGHRIATLAELPALLARIGCRGAPADIRDTAASKCYTTRE